MDGRPGVIQGFQIKMLPVMALFFLFTHRKGWGLLNTGKLSHVLKTNVVEAHTERYHSNQLQNLSCTKGQEAHVLQMLHGFFVTVKRNTSRIQLRLCSNMSLHQVLFSDCACTVAREDNLDLPEFLKRRNL